MDNITVACFLTHGVEGWYL